MFILLASAKTNLDLAAFGANPNYLNRNQTGFEPPPLEYLKITIVKMRSITLIIPNKLNSEDRSTYPFGRCEFILV